MMSTLGDRIRRTRGNPEALMKACQHAHKTIPTLTLGQTVVLCALTDHGFQSHTHQSALQDRGHAGAAANHMRVACGMAKYVHNQ
jgi:hypothetical protein